MRTPAANDRSVLLPLTLALVLPLLLTLALGQDGNWDLRNYHLYNPHAWLHGRLLTDIAPAQLQTWHNPLLDLPLYLLVSAGASGVAVALWLTLPYMLALFLLLRLHARLSPEPPGFSMQLLLCLLAIGGVDVRMEIGASMNDGFVAAGVVGALYLLFRNDVPKPWHWCVAGVIAGATAGLKLTAAIYCIGFAAAAVPAGPIHRAPQRLLALLIGGIAGFALTYGYWGWTLFDLYGNPVFPYFNQVFRSVDAPPEAFADLRFVPGSFLDAALVPFRLAAGSSLYAETTLRDPRLLLGLAAWPILLALARRNPDRFASISLPIRSMTWFYLISFAVWVWQYGIYRYLLPLEMLAGLPLLLCLQAFRREWRIGSAVVLALLVVVATGRPAWPRESFRSPMFALDLPPLPAGSMLILSSQEPLAFAALRIDDAVPIVSAYNNFMHPEKCSGLQRRVQSRIAGHEGPLWLLRTPMPADDDGQAIIESAYGLRANSECRPVESSLGNLVLCPLDRRAIESPCPVSR
ncbi:hypothetical protein [Arenimonas sp.]|uniref:hypothetical protein n=1 Tax=Arenimonas sp. TaxID=1872635 RepID=UPI0039E6572F